MTDKLQDGFYVIVSEEMLKKSAEYIEQEDGNYNSAFHKMIQTSQEYKDAGLTPFVVYEYDSGNLVCLVKELYGKKLH